MKRLLGEVLTIVLLFSFLSSGFAAENGETLNLKVGENFYFEKNLAEDSDDSKEASMAEIKRVPFYESTWFIAAVSILAVAGASTAVYFLAKDDEGSGNVVIWGK